MKLIRVPLLAVPLLALIIALNMLTVARAAPSAAAEIEIAYLLGLIEQSDCRFFRNGTWYDAQKAQAHLRAKYDALAANNQINTAEDFIEKAASNSSISGRPYQIRCGAGATVSTNQWFSEALARYRIAQIALHTAPFAPCARTCPFTLLPSSIVESDREFVMDRLDVFRPARQRYGLFDSLLAPGSTG